MSSFSSECHSSVLTHILRSVVQKEVSEAVENYEKNIRFYETLILNISTKKVILIGYFRLKMDSVDATEEESRNFYAI